MLLIKMDSLPVVLIELIYKYKHAMELLELEPKPSQYVSTFLFEERKIICKLTALCFGVPDVIRARDLLDSSVDLVDFYTDCEYNWNQRHSIWGLFPDTSPPMCEHNVGYLVYQWIRLQGDDAIIDSISASCIFGQYCFW